MINPINQHPLIDPSNIAKEKKVAEDFEAIFLRQILNENMGDHSEQMKTIKSMYNGQISKEMSGAGGFGLAEMMIKQWDLRDER